MKTKPKELYAYILGLTSTLYMVMIRGIPLFYFVALAGLTVFRPKKTRMDMFLLGYSFCMLTSVVLNVFTSSHKGTLIFSLMLYAILFFTIVQFGEATYNSIPTFVKGLRHSCYFQLFWCFLQYGLDKFIHMDINDVVFHRLLHMVENASRHIDGKLVLSGICWHPSNMIPVILLLLLFSNNIFVWIACFFVVIKMQSSTALFIVSIALMTRFIFMVFDRYSERLTARSWVIVMGVIPVVIAMCATTRLGGVLFDNFSRLINRVLGVETDLSTMAHRSYYTLFPKVWSQSTLLQKLFGYGPGLSGVPITKITGQYQLLGAWVVESDVMNFIYGIGIVGTIFVYLYFLQLLINTGKDRWVLWCLIIPLLFAGITYNIQYYWVFFFESLLVICKAKGYSIKTLIVREKKKKTIFQIITEFRS